MEKISNDAIHCLCNSEFLTVNCEINKTMNIIPLLGKYLLIYLTIYSNLTIQQYENTIGDWTEPCKY